MTPLDPDLLRAICADPSNTDLRLVAADWWEENGESDRAEFVRCQIAVSAWSGSSGEVVSYVGGIVNGGQAGEMLARSQQLIGDNSQWYIVHPGGNITTELRRGFVERLDCACAWWQQHGPAIVRAQPVTTLKLTDAQVAHQVDGFGRAYWIAASPGPLDLAEMLALYPTEDAASDTFHRLALHRARTQAGLPSLVAV